MSTCEPDVTLNGPVLAFGFKINPSNSLIHKASYAHRIKEILGTQLRYTGVLTTYKPPKTIKITISDGAIATALSTEGATLPMSNPNAVLAIDSTTKIDKKFNNLPGASFNPHNLYMMRPEKQGKNADSGNSADNLDKKYGKTL